MSFRCPGYLNAKSLQSGGVCREDYAEWFSNAELSAYRPLIEAVYKAIQYRGNDPVLLRCDVAPESCLIFRFTMELRDIKGRQHQRCEVIKIEHDKLPELLDGAYKADPEEATGEFVVDGVCGEALPECERICVGGVKISVFSRNANAYWFRNDKSVANTPSKQLTKEAHSRNVRPVQGEDKVKRKEKRMSKVLIGILVLSSALGGWYYVQCDELRKGIVAQKGEIEKCHKEISNLRNENSLLRDKITKYDKWIKTRGNFELNKVQLEIKLNEIKEKFHEAESLMMRINETPTNNALGEPVKHQRSDDDGGKSIVTPSERKCLGSEDVKKKQGVLESIKESISDLVP